MQKFWQISFIVCKLAAQMTKTQRDFLLYWELDQEHFWEWWLWWISWVFWASWIWRVSSQLEQFQSFVVVRLGQLSKNLGLGFGTCSPKKTTPVSNLQQFSPKHWNWSEVTKLIIFTGSGCSACTQSKHGYGEKGNNGRESSHISPTWAKDIWNRFFPLDLDLECIQVLVSCALCTPCKASVCVSCFLCGRFCVPLSTWAEPMTTTPKVHSLESYYIQNIYDIIISFRRNLTRYALCAFSGTSVSAMRQCDIGMQNMWSASSCLVVEIKIWIIIIIWIQVRCWGEYVCLYPDAGVWYIKVRQPWPAEHHVTLDPMIWLQ